MTGMSALIQSIQQELLEVGYDDHIDLSDSDSDEPLSEPVNQVPRVVQPVTDTPNAVSFGFSSFVRADVQMRKKQSVKALVKGISKAILLSESAQLHREQMRKSSSSSDSEDEADKQFNLVHEESRMLAQASRPHNTFLM
jgi:hypothetical protein